MTDLFEGNPSEEVEPAPAEAPDPNQAFADQLQAITAEDGRMKYATVQEALNAMPHAQSKIKEQAETIEQLKQQLNQSDGVQEMLQELKGMKAQPAETPTAADPEAIQKMVQQAYESTKSEEQKLANGAQVKDVLVKQFGDSAEQKFKDKAQELGMSTQELTQLSMTKPKAAMALFTVTESQGSDLPETSRVPAEKQEQVYDAEKAQRDFMRAQKSDNELAFDEIKKQIMGKYA